MADIEGRGTYHRMRVEVGTELTPPQIDTGEIEAMLMSGEILLEASE